MVPSSPSASTSFDRSDRILDRSATAAHPLFVHWQTASSAGAVDTQSVAHNLAADPHVHVADDLRARDLCHETASYGATLGDALGRRWEQVHIPYADKAFAGAIVRLPMARRLSHLESFAGLVNRLNTATDGQRESLRVLLKSTLGLDAVLPLNRRLAQDQIDLIAVTANTLDEDEFRGFVGDLLALMGPRPFWWACLDEEIKLLHSSPQGMASALGLGGYGDGHWVLRFTYPASQAGLLYVPTIFEAAKYAFFFPAPGARPSGLTMPLDETQMPRSEYLHCALDVADASTAAVPGLQKIEGWMVEGGHYDQLRDYRQRQWRRYARETANITWTSRHQWRDGV